MPFPGHAFLLTWWLKKTCYNARSSNSIVLPKPGKADYSTLASFRVIALLPTVSKILERITARWLFRHAKPARCLNQQQCASLPTLSCPDTVSTLTHDVTSLQDRRLEPSALFLDIKCGFDNVLPIFMLRILSDAMIPVYIINWVLCFITRHRVSLIFQGAPGTPRTSSVACLKAHQFLPFCSASSSRHSTSPYRMA